MALTTDSGEACCIGRMPGWRGVPGDDVRGVGLPATGQADVQGPAGQGAGDQQVGGVHGPALPDVGVARVVQLGAVRQVRPGDQERAGPGPAELPAPHLDVGPVPSGDLQRVAVGQLPAARVDLRVEPGPDQVAGTGLVAVRQRGVRPLDGAELDQLGLDPAGQLGGLAVGPGQQQDVLAAQVVGQPHAGRAVHGRFLVGAAHLPVPVVGGVRGEITGPQPHRRVGFPGCVEPADLMQLRARDFPGQQPEHPAGLDRAELLGVADQGQPRPGGPGGLLDHRQVGRAELAGLIQHQHVVLDAAARAGAARRSLRSCRGTAAML